MNSTTATRFIIMAALSLSLALAVLARQDSQPSGQSNDVGPSAETIRPYRVAGRDPFRKFVKPKEAKGASAKQKTPTPRAFPPITARRAEFQQKVEQARARDLPDPDPVTQYLVGELDIMGVFRDDRGYGAFVRAQPTGTTFFVRNGSRCYNGEVVRIENDDGETEGPKVLFREVSYLELNGKQTPQERVVAKFPVASASKKK
jgi:hypothetical protein